MDSNLTENIVLYDWLSFSSKKHSPDQLIAALGLSHIPWIETKGARGYRCRKYFSCISIHYDGRDDMGVWCELSGQGCRTFESLSTVGWDALFRFIHDNGLKITRLDIAYDDHTGILPMSRIMDDTRCGLWVGRSRNWEIHESNKGSSVGIGSLKSEVFIRIYDKAAERGKTDEHWIRVELQLRDDRACQFSLLQLEIGEAFAGVLLNYLRYVEPNEADSNPWRWPLTDYWESLVEDAQAISIYRSPGMEYNEEKLKYNVTERWGNAIDAAIEIYGLEEFQSMVEARQARPNPKYQMIVEQHKQRAKEFRFQELVDKVKRFFGPDSIR